MSLSYGSWDITDVSNGDGHNKGYYTTSSALSSAYPTAFPGDYAIVGSTNTVWVWDETQNLWVDTDTKGQVSSVNGYTGAVVLSANDVGAVYTGGANVTVQNNVISCDQYPVFTVNSGNVDIDGNGDLIGTITYTSSLVNNYTVNYGSGYTITNGVLERSDSNGNVNISSVDLPTISNTDNWTLYFKMPNFANPRDMKVDMKFLDSTLTDRDIVSIQTKSSSSYLLIDNQGLEYGYTRDIDYWFKVEYTGGTRTVSYSLDGTSYSVLKTSTETGYTFSQLSVTVSFYGRLDMKEWYLLKGDTEVWRAVDTVSAPSTMSFKVGTSYPAILATNGIGERFNIDSLDSLSLQGLSDGDYNIYIDSTGVTYANTGALYIQNAIPVFSTEDVWVNTSVYPYKITKGNTTTVFNDIPIGKFTLATQMNGSVVISDIKTYPYNRSLLFSILTTGGSEFYTVESSSI